METTLHRRAVQRILSDRLDEAPVVRLSGPRAAGKTTSCVAEITRRGGSIVPLDDPEVRDAVAADAKGYLSGLPPPVLVDEYQRVPLVLDVIKTSLLGSRGRSGGWLLSGSVSIQTVAQAAETFGGRLNDVAMGTLSLDERNDLPEPTFLARLLDQGPTCLRGWRPTRPLGRDELLSEAVRGGFPLVADRGAAAARRRGLEDWVNASVIADGAAVGGIRNTEGLRRMLRLYAAATASVTPKDRPLADQLGIDRRTVASYRDLLTGLYVIWDLPAFLPGNATGQVLRSPKLHIVDSGLAAFLAGRDQPSSLGRDPGFTGSLIETMVANDLRVQATVHPDSPRLLHYREESHEVDLVVERYDGTAFGIEVKLASNPGDGDLGGLRRLRRSSGSRWGGGVLLCRVPVGRITHDDIAVAPLETVWSSE
jgi:hypothetical protein